MPDSQNVEQIGWQTGMWYASTTGRFMPMLLDRGPNDNVVIWREVETLPEDPETGEFISHMEILIVPESQVITTIRALQRDQVFGGVDKVLREFIRNKLIT